MVTTQISGASTGKNSKANTVSTATTRLKMVRPRPKAPTALERPMGERVQPFPGRGGARVAEHPYPAAAELHELKGGGSCVVGRFEATAVQEVLDPGRHVDAAGCVEELVQAVEDHHGAAGQQ